MRRHENDAGGWRAGLPGDQSAFAVKIASRGVEEQRVASWQVESILRGKVDALDRLDGGILGTCVHHGVNGRGIVRRARDVLQPERSDGGRDSSVGLGGGRADGKSVVWGRGGAG